MIYLKHETHGTKIALCEQEAVFDEENGWKRYNPNQVESEIHDEFESVRAKWEEKFGKKPHHKKSLETLLDELESAP